jgi:L,D-transpeptidase ErfK/SrfK
MHQMHANQLTSHRKRASGVEIPRQLCQNRRRQRFTRINALQAIRSIPSLVFAALLSTAASATTYELGEGTPQIFGEITHYTTTYEDTFTDIARRYSLGWEEVIRVNPGIDPWVPGAGKELLIPTQRILPSGPHEGIVINLPEHRLYYFPKPKKKGDKPIVITYAVSIGKMDWHTPLGETRIVSKQKNPNWYPPESVRKEHAERGEPLPAVVKPGPDNPLGAYAMRLGITPGAYLIHGTNNPLAVGMAVTHGCMRMYPEDIEALFPLVPVGTKVRIVNEPVKVAFVDGELLLEVHPPVDGEGQTIAPDLQMFSGLLDQALGSTTAAVHWDLARETMQAANGLPTVVGLQADLDEPPDTQIASADGQPADGTQPQTLSGQPPIDGAPVNQESTSGTPPNAAPPTASAQQAGTMPPMSASTTPGASASPQPSAITLSTAPALPATPPVVVIPEKSLPAPALPPADPATSQSPSGTRTFGAGDPATSTAQPVGDPNAQGTPAGDQPPQQQ